MSLVKLARITNQMTDTEIRPYSSVAYLDGASNAVIGNVFGLHTSPSVNTPCLMFCINGDPANKVVIPLSINLRVKGLEEREVAVGAFDVGNYIKFDKDGNITITLPGTKKYSVKNDNNNLTELIKDLCSLCESITTMTGIGIQPVLNKADFTALKAKLAEFVE